MPLNVVFFFPEASLDGCRGGGVSWKESELPREVPDFLSSRVLPSESLKLGNYGVEMPLRRRPPRMMTPRKLFGYHQKSFAIVRS
jgi:hypothetical protein